MATYRCPDPVVLPGGWVPVASSCLSAIRVVGSPTASAVTLQVEFTGSGRRYEARGVPHDMVADLLLAPSVGVYYNQNLKQSFTWRRI